MLIAACLATRVKRLVFTGSPSVVFDGRDQANGTSALPYAKPPSSHYSATKAASERLVLKANSKELATVSLRPHLIYGPGDPHLVPRVIDRASKRPARPRGRRIESRESHLHRQRRGRSCPGRGSPVVRRRLRRPRLLHQRSRARGLRRVADRAGGPPRPAPDHAAPLRPRRGRDRRRTRARLESVPTVRGTSAHPFGGAQSGGLALVLDRRGGPRLRIRPAGRGGGRLRSNRRVVQTAGAGLERPVRDRRRGRPPRGVARPGSLRGGPRRRRAGSRRDDSRSAKARDVFTLARGLLRFELSKRVGVEPSEIHFDLRPSGKPDRAERASGNARLAVQRFAHRTARRHRLHPRGRRRDRHRAPRPPGRTSSKSPGATSRRPNSSRSKPCRRTPGTARSSRDGRARRPSSRRAEVPWPRAWPR